MSDQITQLNVDTNSWHFKYFCFIRKLFGIRTKKTVATSLCVYVQTMLWGSAFFVLSLPLQSIGLLFVKLTRFIYKKAVQLNMTPIVNIIDFTIGYLLSEADKVPDERSPFIFYTGVGGIFCISCAIIAMLVCLSFIGLGAAIAFLPRVPYLLLQGLMILGWAVVWACATLVYGVLSVFSYVGAGVSWLFSASWLWLLLFEISLWCLGFIVVSIAVTMLFYWLSSTEAFERFLDYMHVKYNGYAEARKQADVARIEAAKLKQQEPKTDTWLDRLGDKLRLTLSNFAKFFLSKTYVVGNTSKKILSPMALIWHFGWALKKRACPVIQFVNAEEIEKQSS